MQPAAGVSRIRLQFAFSHRQRLGPILAVHRERPAHFEDIEMALVGRGNLVQFRAGIGGAAQAQPANGGVEMMIVRRFQSWHRQKI